MKTFRDIDYDLRINGGLLVTSIDFPSRFSGPVVFEGNQESIKIAPLVPPSLDLPIDVFSVVRGNLTVMSIDSNGKIYAPEMIVDTLTYSEVETIEGDLESSGKIISAEGAILGNDNDSLTEVYGTFKVVRKSGSKVTDILTVNTSTNEVIADNFVGSLNGHSMDQTLNTSSSVSFSRINGLRMSSSGIIGTNKIGDISLVSSAEGISRTVTVGNNIRLDHDTHAKTTSDDFRFDQDLTKDDSPEFKGATFSEDVYFPGGLWDDSGLKIFPKQSSGFQPPRLDVGGPISVSGTKFIEPGNQGAILTNIEYLRFRNNSTIGSTTSSNDPLYLNGRSVQVNRDGQLVIEYEDRPPILLVPRTSGSTPSVVKNLNSELLDGYFAQEIIDVGIGTMGSGVISGLQVSALDIPVDKKFKISSGQVAIKGTGILKDYGEETATLEGSAASPKWNTILISSHSFYKNETTHKAGTLTTEAGTDSSLPSLSQYRDPIILAHVRVNSDVVNNDKIYPARTFTSIHVNEDTNSIQFLRYENSNTVSGLVTSPVVRSKVEIHPINGLIVEDTITANKIKTAGGPAIDVSGEAAKWNVGYQTAHTHIYGKKIVPDGISKVFNFDYYMDPSTVVVYKNGLRQLGFSDNDQPWDYKATSGYSIEFFNTPSEEDIITVDYITFEGED